MRIKNFVRFINENLEPEPVEDKTIIGDVRKGEPEDEPDYDHFDYEDWQPTGDKPRKQNSDISLDFHPNNYASGEEFDYDDYYPDEEDEDHLGPMYPDEEQFISDTDVESDTSERDDIFY